MPAVSGDVSSESEDSESSHADSEDGQAARGPPNAEDSEKQRWANSPTEYYTGRYILRKQDSLFVRDEEVPNRQGIEWHRRGHVRITVRGEEDRVFQVYRGCVAIVLEGDKYVGVSASASTGLGGY